MRDTHRWARRRQIQYGSGFAFFWILVFTGLYYQYFYQAPNCFDGVQNADERGIDCGGGCERICTADVIPPRVRWAQSFEVRPGQYNAVAYVENQNPTAGTPEIGYTLSVYDAGGLILEQTGSTILPPDSVYPIFVGPINTSGRVPTNTFLELQPADLWLPAESGRNQFTITDQALSGVDSQPRLAANMRNNAFTAARNVEVVATIFDVRGNALTSSRTFIENFNPQVTEAITFTWPQPIAKTLRSCDVPTDVLMAIDLSGSMNNDQPEPPEPITSVLAAAEAFIDRLRTQDQVAVVTFASEAKLAIPLSRDIGAVADDVRAFFIDPVEETGSTNTGEAFLRAAEEFSSSRVNPAARQVMVILTDGLATAPDPEPEQFALTAATDLKATGVEVYAIGLGEQVNMDFVRQIATDRNYAFQALSRSQVNQIYQTITGAICEDGPAIIDIIPKAGAIFSR